MSSEAEFDEGELDNIEAAIQRAVPSTGSNASVVHLNPMTVMHELSNSSAKPKLIRLYKAALKFYQTISKPVATAGPPTTTQTQTSVTSPSTSKTESIKKTVGPWTFTKILLGQGGFGYVYLAQDERGDFVAVKQLTSSKEAREERDTMSQFHHPAIPRPGVCYQSYLAIEYINGVSLKGLAPLPVKSVLAIGERIAHALAHMHAQGFCHADIKLANIMIDHHALAARQPGCVKLIDFGLAERVKSKNRTERFASDIWMLGRVLAKLTLGEDVEPGDIPATSNERWKHAGSRLPLIIKRCLNASAIKPVPMMMEICRMLMDTPDTGTSAEV